MQNIILFMGQFREPANFRKSLESFREFTKRGLIGRMLFVTDEGEVPGKWYDIITGLGCEVVEKPSLTDEYLMRFDSLLKERRTGNRKVSRGMRGATIWRQLSDLDFALGILPPDSRILRTRTDILIPHHFLNRLLSGSLDTKPGNCGTAVFEEKIWVQWFSMAYPFYIHDTAFYGLWNDLRKLVNRKINIELAQFYPSACLPIFFWLLPFWERPLINSWLECFSAAPFKSKLLKNTEYLKILYDYYKIVLDNFCVEYPDIQWLLQWDPGNYRTRIWHKIDPQGRYLTEMSVSRKRMLHHAAETTKMIQEIIEGKHDDDILVYRMRHDGSFPKRISLLNKLRYWAL